jgi:hypothetical protein
MRFEGSEAGILLASNTRLYCLVKTQDNGDRYHLLALTPDSSSADVLGEPGNIGKDDVVYIVSGENGDSIALVRDARVSLLDNGAEVTQDKLPVSIPGSGYIELTITQNSYTGFTRKQQH